MEGTPNDEQRVIVDLIVQQRISCFITGAAGTGKSFILNHIVRELSKRCARSRVHLTASTGIAAANIGGCTIHSFAGIGIGEGPLDMLIKRALATSGQRWRDAECLIIDEVSMLSGELLDTLDQVARAVRNKPELPFGGLQLVLCGDFCQLGPVNPRGVREYAFEAAVWDKAVEQHVCLKQVLRQEGDNVFIDFLEQLRFGQTSSTFLEAMSQCARPLSIENGVLPTKLYCTNRDVDADNAKELGKLEGKVHSFTASDQGPTNSLVIFPKTFSAPKELDLKIGAQVVLIRRIEDKLVNGSRGVVRAFSDDGLPVVLFNNGMQEKIPRMKWTSGVEGKTFREQVPLRLAWALTVHRCQGMTLDKTECSLADAFAPGQVYTALSRIRSMAGLQVHNFDSSKVKISPKVFSQEKVSIASGRSANAYEAGEDTAHAQKCCCCLGGNMRVVWP